MRSRTKTFLIPVFIAAIAGVAAYFSPIGNPALEPLASTMVYFTPTTVVKDIYPSMLGPENTDLNVKLTEDPAKPELLWVKGYHADMVGPENSEARSQEFMCHNTLSFHDTTQQHANVLGSGFFRTRRLFTLSQGQSSLTFPEGFGMPVSSAEKFMLQSQVLNLHEDRIGSMVRHRVRTDYVSDRVVGRPMTALTLIDFGISLRVLDPQAREVPIDQLSCATDAGGQPTDKLPHGEERTAHWVVKPGFEERHTRLPRAFPFDTRIHYISVHLHSYAESLELRDLTTQESVYLAQCKPTEDRTGLAKVDHYSSVEGIPVYASHDYELISRYNNTSDEDRTAMAFMFCYVADPHFKKPDAEDLALRSDEFCKTR